MNKKILMVVVLLLGLNQLGFADDATDFDAGSSDYTPAVNSSNSKGVIPSSKPGIYLGAQFGFANTHYGPSSSYLIPHTSYDNTYQLAGRGSVGYSFSEFISAELGYNYYGRPKFWHDSQNNQSIMQHGLDLMAKANLPLDYGFGIYIKGGLAWVYRSALRPNSGTFADKPSNNQFPLVGALGINYWFASNIAIDLSWTKTLNTSSLPTIDLVTLGIIYKLNI
jgi:hypothetical protein